jgi:CBS domain containing-hemolysin-like protein
VYAWTWVAYPVIFVGDYLAKGTLHLMGITLTRSWTETSDEEIESRAELRQHLGRLLSEGELSDERRKEVLNALDIEARSTRSIMIDRSDIRAIRVDRSVEENLDLVEEHRYSRYPLIDGNLDEFLGIIYLPALLPKVTDLQEGTASWEDIAAAPMSVPADLPISELVDRFQDERQEMAVVEDEDGTVVGLVTSTDALEAIIGELRDPFDEGA